MFIEIGFDDLPLEILDFIACSPESSTCQRSKDPLETLIELEALATEHGFTNVHSFITIYLSDYQNHKRKPS